MYKVVLTYDSQGGLEVEQEVFGNFAEIVKRPCITEDDLIKNCQDADAVITSYEPFTDRVMASLPNLRIIAFKAIGYNSVDLEASKKRHIAVTNIPNYCTNEVADHTAMLMLAINRRLIQFNNSVQNNREWKYDLCPEITRFGKSTVGLLGFGNIPRLLTDRLKGFGPKIIAYDPFVKKETAEEFGVELVDLDYLYKNADYISCHLPLNSKTEGSIDKEAFSKMKEGVVFINTGRGRVVDEYALLQGLDSNKVGFAALDVLYDENPDMEKNPLLGRDNVILTPHVAFYSMDSVRDAKVDSAENILYYLKGDYERCSIVNGVNTNK